MALSGERMQVRPQRRKYYWFALSFGGKDSHLRFVDSRLKTKMGCVGVDALVARSVPAKRQAAELLST